MSTDSSTELVGLWASLTGPSSMEERFLPSRFGDGVRRTAVSAARSGGGVGVRLGARLVELSGRGLSLDGASLSICSEVSLGSSGGHISLVEGGF